MVSGTISIAMSKELEKKVAGLEKTVADQAEQLRERDDTITRQAGEIERLSAQVSGRKYVDLTEQVPFTASWKTPQGEAKKRKVKFKVPKVRLDDGMASVVGTIALTKLAAGQKLSDQELKESPALADWNQEKAAGLISKWAKIGSGLLVDAG